MARVEHLWADMADDMLAEAKKAKPDLTGDEWTKLRRASIQVLTVLVVAHGHGVDVCVHLTWRCSTTVRGDAPPTPTRLDGPHVTQRSRRRGHNLTHLQARFTGHVTRDRLHLGSGELS